MLTQEQLKQLIHYNPDTGLFTWTVTRGNSCIKGKLAELEYGFHINHGRCN